MINPKVHIVYAHPSKKSITHEIKEGLVYNKFNSEFIYI